MKAGKVLHIILATLIILFMSGHFLLNNKKIQQDAALHLVRIAQTALGTDVSAGRVQLVYPFGITIDNLTIYDLKHDTLAHAASVSLHLKPSHLIRNKISISSIRVNSPKIILNKDSADADPNYAFLTSLFGANPNPMAFRANSVLIRNGTVRYDLKTAEQTDSLFNPNHINVYGLTANLSLKSVSSDSVAIIVRKFSFNEQSGFKLSKIKGAITVGKESAKLSGFNISTPSSTLDATLFTADIGLASKPECIPDANLDIKATVTGSDFKAFMPQLACLTDPVGIKARGKSKDSRIIIDELCIRTPQDTIDMDMSGTIFTDNCRKVTGCRLAQAHGSFKDGFPTWIENQFGGLGLTLPHQLNTLGNGSFNATLDSQEGNIRSDFEITSEAGIVTGLLTGLNGKFNVNLDASDVNLRTITQNRNLGKCSFSAQAQVQKCEDGFSGTFGSRISSIVYNKYNYRNIRLNGSIEPGFIITDLKYADKNGALAVKAGIGTGSIPFYSIIVDADSIDLAAHHFTSNDSITITASLTANVMGNNIDDMIGKITVDSLRYADRYGNWSMDNMTLAVGLYNDFIKVTTVYSDFMSASIVGIYKTTQIPASLVKACSESLPTIGKLVEYKLNTGSYKTCSNSFAVDIKFDNLAFMETVFHRSVSLNDPAHLQMTFNDSRKEYSGFITVPDVAIDNHHITKTSGKINLSDGKCKLDLSGTYRDTSSYDATTLNASLLAHSDMLGGKYSWGNTTGTMSGTAQSLSQFLKYDRRSGLQSISVIDTTNIIINGTIWDLSVAQLATDNHKFAISDMCVSNDNQYLYANGTVSSDSSDIFVLSMKNIDLGKTLTTLHHNDVAKLQGIASGQIFAAGVLANPAFSGSINIDDFQFMDSYHGRFTADCRWNRNARQVELEGTMTDEGISSTGLTGTFVPQTKALDVTLDANHTDLHFLNTWTKTVFKELGGRAVGKLRLFGNLPKLDMEGEAILEDAYFIQDAINTTFNIKRDTLWFEPGKMTFKDVEFYDQKGHDGLLTCILTHDKFSKWEVDMTADVANMLVYYQPRNEKSDIYASVYAEGSMELQFNEANGLAITVDARTAPGTRIGYNSSSGSVADYNFLTIVDRGNVKIDEESVRNIIPQKTRKNKNYSLNFNIECSEDALIEMSMASLNGFFRGNGNISLKFSPKDGPIVNGIYNLSYGQCALSIEDIIRKNFTLMEGSYVRFNGAPLDTEINLQTYHNVNSASIYDLDPSASSNNKVHVRCLMGITGNVTDPRMTFDIDMPSGTPEEKAVLASATTTEEQRNNQFLYLLALGRFYTYDVASDRLTPSTMESLVNNTVSGQINNLLSQVMDNEKISLSSNVSASSYLTNDATNLSNKELEGILEAHLLNNRLLINGNFGYRENTINNTSNFIGDFEFKYLLIPDKRGKGISIKGYNKANDKYFSKTTLTTQGVGLVLEKDF